MGTIMSVLFMLWLLFLMALLNMFFTNIFYYPLSWKAAFFMGILDLLIILAIASSFKSGAFVIAIPLCGLIIGIVTSFTIKGDEVPNLWKCFGFGSLSLIIKITAIVISFLPFIRIQ